MKPNQWATLVLRLIGIYVLVGFIPAISVGIAFIPYFDGEYDHNLTVYQIISFALILLTCVAQFVAGILLIVKSVRWGERLAPQNSAGTTATPVSFEQVQALTFAALGVLIFAGTLPQLYGSFWSACAAMQQMHNPNQLPGDAARAWRTLFSGLGPVAEAALGICLFFGARGFANFWRSMRSFGTPKPPGN